MMDESSVGMMKFPTEWKVIKAMFQSPPTMNNYQLLAMLHYVKWDNSLFLWPCSIAMLNYQRVSNLVLKRRLAAKTTENPAARLANWPQIHAHFKMIKPELKPVNPHICRLNMVKRRCLKVNPPIFEG